MWIYSIPIFKIPFIILINVIKKETCTQYLSGLNEVSIIHGKGTGILREGIKQYLKSHKYVKEFRVGNFNEGGDGITIVSFS